MEPSYKSLLRGGRSTSSEDRQEELRQMRTMRSVDVFYPYFRRMEYIRYGEDFVVLISGSFGGGLMPYQKLKTFSSPTVV